MAAVDMSRIVPQWLDARLEKVEHGVDGSR